MRRALSRQRVAFDAYVVRMVSSGDHQTAQHDKAVLVVNSP